MTERPASQVRRFKLIDWSSSLPGRLLTPLVITVFVYIILWLRTGSVDLNPVFVILILAIAVVASEIVRLAPAYAELGPQTIVVRQPRGRYTPAAKTIAYADIGDVRLDRRGSIEIAYVGPSILRRRDAIRYERFHPEDARAVYDDLRRRVEATGWNMAQGQYERGLKNRFRSFW